MKPAIELLDRAPDPAAITELYEHLNEFNFEATGYRDGRDLDLQMRQDGQMVAGLSGYTWGGIAEVKVLWVREDRRQGGLGSALMEAAIGEARARGCRYLFLSTHSFQAQGFYEKLGFVTLATIADKPLGHAEHWMRLTL